MRPSWIFFDVGGVLINDDASEQQRLRQLNHVLARFGVEVSESQLGLDVEEVSGEMLSINDAVLTKYLGSSGQVKEAKDLMRNLFYHESNYFEIIHVRPEAKLVMQELSQRYRLGLMANQPSAIRTVLDQGGVLEYLSSDVVSSDLRIGKPNPIFFLSILEATGAKPQESVIVDDNVKRALEPAKLLGMQTVWYQRKSGLESHSDSIDHRVNDLSQLLQIF